MKEQQPERLAMPHLITVSERNELTVTGVRDVDNFDDTSVVIYTTLGELTVRGSELHIGRLNTETGDMTLSGSIDSLTYSEWTQKSGGFFRRLFR